MEKVEYDLDTSGGLMEEIQALVAPPQSADDTRKKPFPSSSSSSKEPPKEPSISKRPIRTVNRDCCDACNEGGDLLCCDQCPSSFHLQCCDPPLEDEDVPTGEWICNECKFGVKKKSDMKLFRLSTRREASPSSPVDANLGSDAFVKLAQLFRHKNPKEFQLPADIQDFTVMPGDRKKQLNKDKDKEQVRKRDDDGQRLCFVCTRSQRVGDLVNCDFCPLVYHRDCLMPPLGQDPLGLWMCPNHPENFEPRLRHPKYSQRSQVIEELRSNINHNAVKLQFFRRAKKERILMNRSHHQPKKRRTCVVPDVVKCQYAYPPAQVVPDYLDHLSKTLQPHRKPFLLPTNDEKDQWLRAVIDLQCSIAGSLEKQPTDVVEVNNDVPNVGDVTVKKELDTTVCKSDVGGINNNLNEEEKALPNKKEVKEEAENCSDGEKTVVAEEKLPKLVAEDHNEEWSGEREPNDKDISEGCVGRRFQMDHDGLCMRPPPDEGFSSHSRPRGKSLTTEDEKQRIPSESSDQREAMSEDSEATDTDPEQEELLHCTELVASEDTNAATATTNTTDAVNQKIGSSFEKDYDVPSTPSSPLFLPAAPPFTESIPTRSSSTSTTTDSQSNNLVSCISTEILKDPTLGQLDERLVRILAFQRLQQLIERKSQQIPKISVPGITEKRIISQVTQSRRCIAVLSPLNSLRAGCYMRHNSFNVGQGGDMDLCLSEYGFCNYVSGKHATMFYDKETHQFELLNYSEHGTIVDNVLYSCDFSDKTRNNITSSNAKHSTSPTPAPDILAKPPIGRTTRGFGTESITQGCNCRASASSLIGGSGAGWEGSALLHHGSYIKFGCLHFVFSIVDCASNTPGHATGVDATTDRILVDGYPLLHETQVDEKCRPSIGVREASPGGGCTEVT